VAPGRKAVRLVLIAPSALLLAAPYTCASHHLSLSLVVQPSEPHPFDAQRSFMTSEAPDEQSIAEPVGDRPSLVRETLHVASSAERSSARAIERVRLDGRCRCWATTAFAFTTLSHKIVGSLVLRGALGWVGVDTVLERRNLAR